MSAITPDSYSSPIGTRSRSSVRIFRTGLVLIGLATLIAFLAAGGARHAPSAVLVPFSVCLGFVVCGVTVGTHWNRSAFWFSVAIVGQALSFQLINAGYQLRYQHYKPFNELLAYPDILYSAGILAQVAVVAYGLRKRLSQIISWTRGNLRVWQLVLLGLCFFLPTTTVSPDVWRYLGEFAVAGLVQLLNLATIILFAMSVPSRAIESLRSSAMGIIRQPSLVWVTALFVVVLAVVLNIFSYERHPHVPDEVVYLMQARFFATGELAMPAPTVPEAFEVFLMKVDGALWYPVTPPGWALLLAIGVFVGAPFLVNPILAGLNVLLVSWLVARLYPDSIAKNAIFLLALSPWFIFLAMSFMTHMAALACLLIAAVSVVKAREANGIFWGLVSGLAIGFISTIRPLEAVAVAGLMGLWMLGVGGKRLSILSMTASAIGVLLIGGLGLAFNAKLTGDPLKFPINQYVNEVFGPGANDYGFGPNRGMGWELDPYPGHGPVDALVNTNLNVSALNSELLGWSIGSFLMIGALFCFGKLRRSDYLMLALIAVIYILHFFYYFSGGPDFGARYWFLMIVPLIVLTVRGIEALATKLNEHDSSAGARLYAAVGVLVVISLGVFVPWRAMDKYHNFRGMRPDIRELNDEYKFGRSLVLIQGNKHPEFDSGFIYNSVDLSGDGPVFAWDKDAGTRMKLLAAYSDRPVWIIQGPSLTGDTYRVSAGPLAAASLTEPGRN